MRAFFEFIVRRPWVVLVVMPLVLLVFALALPDIRFDNKPDSFIPPDHPAFLSKRLVEKTFGLEDPMLLAVVTEEPDGIYARAPLKLIQTLSEQISAKLALYPTVVEHPIYSLATELDVDFDEGLLLETPYLDPFPKTAEDFSALKESVRRLELYTGVIVSEDGSAGAIIVVPPREKAEEINDYLATLIDENKQDGIKFFLAGEASVRSHMGRAVQRDALRLNPLCVVIITLFLILSFRTFTGVLLPLLVVGWGSVVMLGFMALTDSPVYIITNAILVTVVSLGVADAIHVQGEYYRELSRGAFRDRADLVVRANLRVWTPIVFTSVTDMAGFLSFYFTGTMPPLKDFGIFTAIGCGATLIASLSLLPACLALLDPGQPRHQRRKNWAISGPTAHALSRGGEVIRKHPARVSLIATVLVLGALAAASRMRLDQSMVSAFDEDSAIVRADAAINRLFHGTYFLDIVLEAREPDALVQPEMLRKIHRLEEDAKKLPHVKGSISIAAFARKLNQILNDWDEKHLRIPKDKAIIVENFALLESSPSKKADFLRVVDPDYRLSNVRLRLSSGVWSEERKIVEFMQGYLEKHFPPDGPVVASLSGRVNMDYHWVLLIFKSHISSVGFALVLIFVCLMLMFRSLTAGLLCVVPVGIGILTTYAVMGLLGIDLSIGTSMFASLAMGVGVNFPIHILSRMRLAIRHEARAERDAFREVFSLTGKALLFNGMAICCGFLALTISDLPILRHFGLMIAVGIGAACLTSLTLLPALVAWIQPRFIYGSASTAGGNT